jgi:MotA/TolQ/ExbB proton channel family
MPCTPIHRTPASPQLTVDLTPQGLRIQMLDTERVPMLATGSSTFNDRARELLQTVVPAFQRLPENITIGGYTDATPHHGNGRSNWELFADRANGLPALGIVAAVLGVIKTMSHIDQPPKVLGAMIGGALVGTFLGVLLAYGMVGPFSARLRGVIEEESKYFEVIRAVLVAHLHGNALQVSVETGRKMAPNQHMPSFQELEQAVQTLQIS